MNKFLTLLATFSLFCISLYSQPQFAVPTRIYVMHSSGNHLEMNDAGGGIIASPTASARQQMTMIPDGMGYYNIQAGSEPLFLALTGDWNTSFISDSTSSNAKYAIEKVSNTLVKLRCKANNRYLGTDSNSPNKSVYSDKNGEDIKHHWFFSETIDATLPVDTATWLINPSLVRQHFTGWGVSLCWWARMCGEWDDEKIDEIVTWLVSPTGLNYRFFRYNIGGGDDPENNNCTEHHMGEGKGLRAEMDGFKDFSEDEYHWDRDAGQRKIMLKIKEKRPDAVFEAFSNSAPYYMTYSGCVAGNTNAGKDNLRPEYYEEFAHYLVDVCKHYKEEYGIEFATLEPFNEPVTNYWGANGGQEGCHFDATSQVEFLKVLAPILEASGLNTVISASDETSVSQSVKTFNQYMDSNVLHLVGQWNTHTYGGNNADRCRISHLAYQANKPLWMSEVGAGGTGLSGNLSLAQKLIDDMRYIQPEAWIDWQYMEENNDQWCTIKGSFSEQTYAKVKNYYVRQQCTRFIKEGYNIVTSTDKRTLAAVNEAQDTLVLVILNEGSDMVHKIDLSFFSDLPSSKSRIKAYRTSESEDLARFRDYELQDNLLTVNIPTQSITTLVIPANAKDAAVDFSQPDMEYLIIPRHENTRAISADATGKVTIQNIDRTDDAQRWTIQEDGDAFTIKNAAGQLLTAQRATDNNTLVAQTHSADEQTFYIENVDPIYVKILSTLDSEYAFDLTEEKTANGTRVGLWTYNTSTSPTHRQWMLFPLPTDAPDAINELQNGQSREHNKENDGIYDLTGRRLYHHSNVREIRHQLLPGIYIIQHNGNSRKVYIK